MTQVHLYDCGLLALLGDPLEGLEPLVDWTHDTLKVALTGPEYVPDVAFDSALSDIGSEIVGAGYEPGGAVLNARELLYNAEHGELEFRATDVRWAQVPGPVARAVIYAEGTNAAESLLIGFVDFDAPYPGGPLHLGWEDGCVLAVSATESD